VTAHSERPVSPGQFKLERVPGSPALARLIRGRGLERETDFVDFVVERFTPAAQLKQTRRRIGDLLEAAAPPRGTPVPRESAEGLSAEVADLRREVRRLRAAIARFSPAEPVDRADDQGAEGRSQVSFSRCGWRENRSGGDKRTP
jgi:hypothetical protein